MSYYIASDKCGLEVNTQFEYLPGIEPKDENFVLFTLCGVEQVGQYFKSVAGCDYIVQEHRIIKLTEDPDANFQMLGPIAVYKEGKTYLN